MKDKKKVPEMLLDIDQREKREALDSIIVATQRKQVLSR